MRSKDTSPPAPRWAWLALVVVGVIGQILMIIWFHVWQDDVRDLMGVPRLGFWDHPLAAVLSIVVLFIFVEIGQLIGRAGALPGPSAQSLCAAAGFGRRRGGPAARADHRAAQRRRGPVRDEHASTRRSPRSTTRPIPSSLRRRRRCARAARNRWSAGSRWAIRAGCSCRRARRSRSSPKFNGKPAIEPIRAYAGLHSADGIKATAAAGRRGTAAHRRPGPRGGRRRHHHRHRLDQRGRGLGAGVHVQRQHRDRAACSTRSCPAGCRSWSTRRTRARPARRCSRPSTRWSARCPRAQRPKLVVFGESLGSFGGEAPFLALNNLVARTDGALFSGPTFNNTIWADLTRNRDKGSPEWLPIYDKGENVRFAARAGQPRPARRPVGPTAGGVPAARVRPDRLVERRICCSPNRTGCASPAATTCHRGWSGSRS